MTKFKAAVIHLSLSVFFIGLLYLIINYIWYAKPLFEIAGVVEPLKLLILIDVIIGPLLTFVVYKAGKKHLKIDLSIIALIQIAALSYGIITIYQGRPSIIVFNNGQFHFLHEKYANNQDLKFDELKPHYFSAPKMAYTTTYNGIEFYSSYAEFVPMDDYDSMLLPSSLSVETMKAQFTAKDAEITALNNRYKGENIVFFKMAIKETTQYVVYSTKNNTIIDYLKF